MDEKWGPPLTWKLETQAAGESSNRYRDYWGDEYGWTALLPIAWKSFELPGFSIRPTLSKSTGEKNTYKAASYWTMPIHLLGLGMGWTDIRHGLKIWRELEYPLGQHPILDFIWRSYGEDIRALEVYFGAVNRWDIFDALRSMSTATQDGKPTGNRDLPYLEWEREYQRFDSAEKPSLTAMLFNGGSDPLHLERHIVGSFRPADSNTDRPEIRETRDGLNFKVTYDSYAGWAYKLAHQREFQQFSEDGFREDLEIQVELRDFGYLGRFMHHNESGRYFYYSDSQGAPSLQWDSHRWGNPVDRFNN
jgi:hypothetical protein